MMKIAQKTKIRKAFNDSGIQISVKAINLIDDELNRILSRWVKNTKWSNLKRLKDTNVWCALGNWNEKAKK